MASPIRGNTSRGESVLRKKECCDLVITSLEHSISIHIQGKLSQRTIFQALTAMAVDHQSIHSISNSLTLAPCETSMRYHLNKLSIQDLEPINNQILTGYIDAVLKRGHPYQFAIDYTHDPYYGKKNEENEDYIIRSRLKKSTTDFIHISHCMSLQEIGSLPWQCFLLDRGFQRFITWLNV